MATVHRALDSRSGHTVALKRIFAELNDNAEMLGLFVREAKLSALLVHPNIVPVHEYGVVDEQHYIAFGTIAETDLRRCLQQAYLSACPPPLGVVLTLLTQLCEALDHLHSALDVSSQEPLGLVHRDLSPSNILLSECGELQLCDFGVAHASHARFETQSGRPKGKLRYMSPEVVTASKIDARADLFAVGIIAHELLTTRPLFKRATEYGTMEAVVRGEVSPPSQWNGQVSRRLDKAIMHALVREPAGRWASARALSDELERIADLSSVTMSPASVAMWLRRTRAQEQISGRAESDWGHPDDVSTEVDDAVVSVIEAAASRPTQVLPIDHSQSE
jgi:serine/threonine-protein kinase